jgi:hypothetical protein
MEQGIPLLWRSVAPGARVKHLNHPQGKEGIRLKAPLMTEKVQLNKQLIHQPPVEGADHMGKGGMESSLAVGNSEKGAHAAHGSNHGDLSDTAIRQGTARGLVAMVRGCGE